MPPQKVHLIAAARPNFMKVAPLWHALEASPDFAMQVVNPYDRTPAVGNIDAYISGTAQRAKQDPHFVERVVPATDTLVAMPEGWTGQEMIGYWPSQLGDDLEVRIIVARAPDRRT